MFPIRTALLGVVLAATSLVVAVPAVAIPAVAAPVSKSVITALKRAVVRQPHSSLRSACRSYTIYKLTVTKTTGVTDVVAATTCAMGTVTTPIEVGVYRVHNRYSITLIKTLAISSYNNKTKIYTAPSRYSTSGKKVVVHYFVWSLTDSGCCPSHVGVRTFTWTGHKFAASAYKVTKS